MPSFIQSSLMPLRKEIHNFTNISPSFWLDLCQDDL